MQVEENKIITITYELRDGSANGELLERMDARYPFIFLFGTGKLLASFETQLRGLQEDSSFEFVLKAAEAYGRSNALNILKIEVDNFHRASDVPDHYIKEGNMVNLTDDEGLRHNGKILSITDEYIEVDFNHAMVDKDLHFKGAILNIREASLDELIKGHYIEEDGVRR
ncbi:MAG: hypothetical protein AAFO94_01210 [Bacteroidota bacterium]